MRGMELGHRWGRTATRAGAVLFAGLLVVAGPACSKSDDSDSSSTTLDVGVDPPNDPPTTTAPTKTTTANDPEPGATTTTTEAVEGEVLGGALDGQADGIDVSLTRADGTIRNFTVRNLEIQCLPVAGNGATTTRTVDVIIAKVPVGADGLVDFTAEDVDYAPQLSGSFADDGRFIGGLYLSQQVGDEVCGGEFTFELDG